MSRNVITRWLLLALACGPLGHRGSAVADSRIDFARDVRPVLTRHCIRCHGDQRQEGGLRLSSRSTAFAAADTGSPVIVPGKPDASLLLQRVTSDTLGDRMPADSPPMSEREAAILRRWILEGAKWPETQSLRHWAYVAPQRPVPPDVPVEPHGNPIDQFIDVRLRDAALQPNPRADKAQRDLMNWMRSSQISRTLPGNAPSTACWPRRATANAGRSTGSIWHAMQTQTDSRRTSCATSGPTETG